MESPLRAGAGEPGLRLIETALWDGAACPRRDGHLARLSATGAADAGFRIGVNSGVSRVLIQPGGKVVVAGGFTQATSNSGPATRNGTRQPHASSASRGIPTTARKATSLCRTPSAARAPASAATRSRSSA